MIVDIQNTDKGCKMIKLGSLFDGAGTFPFAGKQYGVKPVWASEIEPFPVSVTSKRFPKMKHLGDITKINGADIEPLTSSPLVHPVKTCLLQVNEQDSMVRGRGCLWKQ